MKSSTNIFIQQLSITFLIFTVLLNSSAHAYYKINKPVAFLSQANSDNIQQSKPKTFEQFIDIKQQKINNCITGTIKYKIADRATANKLCHCTIGVRSKMTIGQLWEIESYAQSGIDPTTLPYVIKMQQDLQKCTIGLILSPPQRL